jgi:alkanesulfonate monooxygenase SsuD/methylene tetrahydromethanopterin reductase-like flavin-dependent oxidoreductase (luciferase family)
MELGLTLVGDATEKTAETALSALLRLCDTAQHCGLQTLWFTEHHHNPTRASSALTVLMAAAGARTTMKLGTATLLPALHDAVRLAEAMGTLEALYPGRMLWGFGKGGRSEIAHTHLGHITPENARVEMLRNLKRLSALRENATLVPPLLEQTPWFVASRDASAVRLAARNGMGLMFGHKWPLASLVGIVSTYKKAHPEGKAPQIMLSRHFLCDNSSETAQETALRQFASRRSVMRAQGRSLAAADDASIIFDESLVGTPDECHVRMENFKAMGVTHLSLRPVTPDVKATTDSLARLAP